MDNLALWKQHEDIDPKFTKAIVGKPYKGTSPNPQYVIRCLTEMFGPVGQGFGWDVVAEAFEPLGVETLHWCRIKFWHTDRANTFDAYGQTKAVYPSKGGAVIVDEDAPKKSLTDAIVKAASQIGVAAGIFLGRWDDQKYVAEVAAEYREAEAPPFNAKAAADRLIAAFAKAKDTLALDEVWFAEKDTRGDIKDANEDEYARVSKAAAARKAELAPKDKAA